jgi:Lar family restriction alleviation protein
MVEKDNSTKPELLPCPFCGKSVSEWSTHTQKGYKTKIRCGRCTVTMSFCSRVHGKLAVKEMTIANWNRRA